jgi:hypothetical protein
MLRNLNSVRIIVNLGFSLTMTVILAVGTFCLIVCVAGTG